MRILRVETQETILRALNTDAVARRILKKNERPQENQLVGVRLNINVLKRTGLAAHSIHRASSPNGHIKGRGLYHGEVISYLPVVVQKDAFFSVSQKGREAIASGSMAKHPMASIDGRFIPILGTPSFEGVEISFNPMSSHLFVTSEGYAVQYAQEVTILGHRAYARGYIGYYNALNAPVRAGNAPTVARLKTN